MGYATKGGITAHADDGESITVKATRVGNMYAPDPQRFSEEFLAKLDSDDTVVIPTGPNDTFIAATATKAKTFWVNPGTLARELGKKLKAVSGKVLNLFREKPEMFYRFQPTDGGITYLRLRTLCGFSCAACVEDKENN